MFFKAKTSSARATVLYFCILAHLGAWLLAIYIHPSWAWAVTITFIQLVLAIWNSVQRKHSILRNYPLIGYMRYLIEAFRPELRQYLWESDLDGKPFSRKQRSIVYQRAKGARETEAFGTQYDVTAPGYEWIAHSVFPKKFTGPIRVVIGNMQCKQPYESSILNIGGMSYGALSSTAISALNEGARMGRFAHNTGEGGISPYHLRGGDLIWQIGTGYFGCRDAFGKFSPELFRLKAASPSVKMIELKLSQGAKPGLGGILPVNKNTAEIAAIRKLSAGMAIISPPAHTAFSNPTDLIRFVGFLRALSEGKPVGFKLCVGEKSDFIEICDAICATGIIPDFITIDGSQGGTGSAPMEFSDHVGMPLYDALAFASRTLKSYNLHRVVKIIASGKVIAGFDIVRALSLGASCCYSARGMMFSLGCIQALQCHSGKCPTGIATQDRVLAYGLDISDKRTRVASYHQKTLDATVRLLEACGYEKLSDIDPNKIFRKVDQYHTKSFLEIYFSEQKSHRFQWSQQRYLN